MMQNSDPFSAARNDGGSVRRRTNGQRTLFCCSRFHSQTSSRVIRSKKLFLWRMPNHRAGNHHLTSRPTAVRLHQQSGCNRRRSSPGCESAAAAFAASWTAAYCGLPRTVRPLSAKEATGHDEAPVPGASLYFDRERMGGTGLEPVTPSSSSRGRRGRQPSQRSNPNEYAASRQGQCGLARLCSAT